MAVAIVHTPVGGFTGNVIGITFVDGSADVDNEGQIAYFERHGYQVIFAPVEPVEKTLDEQSKAELEATAEAAGIEFKNPINKADLVALIQANRPE